MSTPIHKDELPREKLLKHGPHILADYELIAILLNTGTKKENVLEIAKRINTKYDLKTLCSQNPKTLTKELGVGNAKACKILAISELARRLQTKEEKLITIKNATDAAELLMPRIGHKTKEELVGIYLNARKGIIAIKTEFIGSLTESLIDPKAIFKTALEENAAAVILAHNHPSGNTTPSQADIDITKQLKQAGTIMGIPLLDHIIVCQNSFTSMRDDGHL